MYATFTSYGAVTVFSGQLEDNPMVGITDSLIVDTADGAMLLVATRGGGTLTAFDLGAEGGDATQIGTWDINTSALHLESTDIAILDMGDGTVDLFLAGLDSPDLQSVTISTDGSGAPFEGSQTWGDAGLDASTISTMSVIDGTSNGLIAHNDGGLSQVTFTSNGVMNHQSINNGALTNATVTHIETTTLNGDAIAIVSYGDEDTISLFQVDSNGDMQHQFDLSGENGLWVDAPNDITFATGQDGTLYAIAASSGSGSLTVIEIAENGEGMRVVDHLLDSLDTRFEDASHVTTITMNGIDFVLAAGGDDGISLFALLDDGRLQHSQTIEGTVGSELQGITGLTATETPDGIRVFVTTQGEPFLVEYELALDNEGRIRSADDAGETQYGRSGDDLLFGGDGDDHLIGFRGDDIFMDGDGADTLSGGSGADLFIFTLDAHRDTITDFDPDEDMIDLSALSLIGGLTNLKITPYSWGAEVEFFGSVLSIYSADGTPLTLSDFTDDNMILSDRIGVEDSLYDMTLYDEPNPPTSNVMPPIALPFPPDDPPDRLEERTIETDSGMSSPDATNGADTITTDGSDDLIYGHGGSDVITAQGGHDIAFGGGGFDRLYGGDGADILSGGGNADTLYGGSGADQLIGGDGYDWLYGSAGDDFLWAGTTADRLFGGDGNDYMDAGTNFGLSVDGLWGGAGNDQMYGGGGYDYLVGDEGNDMLSGGDQADNIYGGTGTDVLFGGQGLDRLFGDDNDDLLSGGTGNDGHFGGDGNDIAWGGDGNDRFFGGSGNDTIMGDNGNDTIYGGAGFDVIVGGEGDDELMGNFNADRFVFNDGHGHDTIRDFEADNLLECIDFASLSSVQSYADVWDMMVQDGNDVVITTGTDSSIRLENVQMDQIDTTDFLF